MLKRKGQSTLEYALIIAVVIAGLLLMQYYVKRGYAGRLKGAADEMGEQYDPIAYSGNYNISQSSQTLQMVSNRTTNTTHVADQTNLRQGNETVSAWNTSVNIYGQ